MTSVTEGSSSVYMDANNTDIQQYFSIDRFSKHILKYWYLRVFGMKIIIQEERVCSNCCFLHFDFLGDWKLSECKGGKVNGLNDDPTSCW